MTTIKDVAKLAEVSVATVSRVLNNSDRVKKDTREKVLNAIEKLNYFPNAVAKTLYNKKSYSIGLIIPDISNPYFTEIARAIEDTANSFGYRVILCNSDNDVKKEKDYIETLSQNYVDGLIVTTTKDSKGKYNNLEVPVVALDRHESSKLPFVSVDNYEGGKLAAKILMESGGKIFGEIRGPSYLENANQRSEGYQNYLKSKGIKVISIKTDFSAESAISSAKKFFDKYSNVDSLFTGNDQIGIVFIKEAIERGINIPEDLQVIGFDGIEFGSYLTPSLSTIKQPIYELGKDAVKLLISLSENKNAESLSIVKEVKYVKRMSTKERKE